MLKRQVEINDRLKRMPTKALEERQLELPDEIKNAEELLASLRGEQRRIGELVAYRKGVEGKGRESI